MEEAKAKRTVAKAQYSRVENALSKLVKNPLSLQETMERKFNDLRTKWQELQDCHDTFILLLDEDSAKKEEEWIEELCERFEAIEADTDKSLQKFRKVEQAVPDQHKVKLQDRGESSAAEQSGLKLPRLELDKFDGNLRKYPAFRECFMKNIAPMCQKSQLGFVLRAHLGEAVKEEVANV